MTSIASLRARLKRLEQQVVRGDDGEIDALFRELPAATLFELARPLEDPSPLVQAVLGEPHEDGVTLGQLQLRVLERLTSLGSGFEPTT